MAHKAKLDILDIEAEIEAEKRKEASPKRWGYRKILFIGGSVLVCVVGVSLWIHLTGKEVPRHRDIAKREQISLKNIARLGGFVIDFEDDGGRYRVLMCDIALTLDKDGDVKSIENRVDVRSTIYKTAKRKGCALLRLPKDLLKKEINTELNNLLGEGTVKTIYFTEFVIL